MNIFIADSNVIIREGLKSILKEDENANIIGESENSGELITMLINKSPDILFINYSSTLMLESDVELIMNTMPHIKVIGITERPERVSVLKYIQNNIDGHLLYSCDKKEIKDSIESVAKDEKFFCGKVLEVMNQEDNQKTFTCGGIRLSKRELEVIEFVAKGLSNKEIAEEMFLSVHTVLTHRKNLMSKLGLKNTAGLVVYAVQNGIHSTVDVASN
ncbi:MAG: response regulator transcription factor [Salibacteraceae bacterium]